MINNLSMMFILIHNLLILMFMINHIMKEFPKLLMKSNTNNNNKHNQDCKCLNLYMKKILKN